MKVMFCRWGTTLEQENQVIQAPWHFYESPCNPIHEASNCEGADNSSNEGEGEDGSNVAKEVLLLHRIASVEDDRRKKDIEEDLRVECGLLIDLIVRSISNLVWERGMGYKGDAFHLLRL